MKGFYGDWSMSRDWPSGAVRASAKERYPASVRKRVSPKSAFLSPIPLAPGVLVTRMPATRAVHGYEDLSRSYVRDRLAKEFRQIRVGNIDLTRLRAGVPASSLYGYFLTGAALAWIGYGLHQAYNESFASTPETFGPFPVGVIAYCTGTGTLQGVIAGGACAEEVHTEFYPPAQPGWYQPAGPGFNPWFWENETVVEVYPPLMNPFTPPGPVGFETYQGIKAGIWEAPSAFDAPPTPTLVPGFVTTMNPAGAPSLPNLDPMDWPILQFAPIPEPWPVRLQPQRRRNLERYPRTREGDASGPAPVRTTDAEVGPAAQGSGGWSGRGRSGSPMRPYEGVHRQHKPPRGTKERKISMRGLGGAYRIIGGVTEFGDWTKALWFALPKELRRSETKRWNKRNSTTYKYPPVQYQAWSLWKHFDQVDMQVAIKNIVIMEVTDLAVGKLSQATQASWRKHQKRYGPAFARGIQVGPAL